MRLTEALRNIIGKAIQYKPDTLNMSNIRFAVFDFMQSAAGEAADPSPSVMTRRCTDLKLIQGKTVDITIDVELRELVSAKGDKAITGERLPRFPVTRVQQLAMSMSNKQCPEVVGVYLTAVVEQLALELLEAAREVQATANRAAAKRAARRKDPTSRPKKLADEEKQGCTIKASDVRDALSSQSDIALVLEQRPLFLQTKQSKIRFPTSPHEPQSPKKLPPGLDADARIFSSKGARFNMGAPPKSPKLSPKLMPKRPSARWHDPSAYCGPLSESLLG